MADQFQVDRHDGAVMAVTKRHRSQNADRSFVKPAAMRRGGLMHGVHVHSKSVAKPKPPPGGGQPWPRFTCPVRSAILKGLRPPAHGCEERATQLPWVGGPKKANPERVPLRTLNKYPVPGF